MICSIHEKCQNCTDNATAACPMFIWSMNYEQLAAWVKAEMHNQNISHQKLSDLSGVPKATIDGIVAGRQHDVGHYTLSSIVRVLMKRQLSESPCRTAVTTAKMDEIADLRAQIAEYRENTTTYRAVIADLRAQIKKYEAAAKKLKA